MYDMSNAITKQILLKVEETEKEIEGNFQQVCQIMHKFAEDLTVEVEKSYDV